MGFSMQQWKTTRWSLVRRAAEEQGKPGQAIAELLQLYRAPILGFLRASCTAIGYRCGEDYHEDLCQEFCASLLGSSLLANADETYGSSFRAYLKEALKKFVSNDLRKTLAHKRGGASVMVDERLDRLASSGPSPEEVFDHEWCASLIEEALNRTCGSDALLHELRPYIGDDVDSGTWASIAARHGMTPGALRTRVARVRKSFRDHIVALVRESVADEPGMQFELSLLRGE